MIAARAGRPAAASRAPRLAPWLTVAVLAGSQFLAVMSTTVVSVALPAIGAGLHASASGQLWIVDAYVIVYSSLLVVGGTIGDRRGRKGMFLLGLVLFGAGSLADSLAPSAGWLLAGRVLQGLGPVLLVPGSLTIIRALFDDGRHRAQAIGLWSTGSGLGMAAGPVVGGLIAAHWGWRWVFGFNVPLAAVLLLAAARLVPRLDRGPASHRLDWAGTVLGSACIAALAFALIEGNPLGWTSPRVLAGRRGRPGQAGGAGVGRAGAGGHHGLDPWDVLHQGLARRTGVPTGTWVIIVGRRCCCCGFRCGSGPGSARCATWW